MSEPDQGVAVAVPPGADGRKWWALGGLALSLLVVGPGPDGAQRRAADAVHVAEGLDQQLQWFANSYNLVMATALLPGGLLGDRFGRKKMLVIALTAFGVASAFCAFAPPGELIVWRAVLGLGAAR